ncbi:MAG: putative glycosyl transferase [Rhodospirillales bacterium]|jgi:Undecaprenyl-phosphate glucose phosphotransferase|nr:putative glycosyl transferase [Rhodospirillales bacterium]
MTVLENFGRELVFKPLRRGVDRPVSLVIVAGILRAVDLGLVIAAGLLIRLLYASGMDFVDWHEYVLAIMLATFAVGTVFQWNGLYRLHGLTARQLKLGKLVLSWTVVVLGLIVVGFFFKISSDFSRFWVGVWFSASLGGMVAARGVVWLLARGWAVQGRLARNIAVVGGGQLGERLIQALRRPDEEAINIIGVFDDRESRVPTSVEGAPKIGTIDDLVTYSRHNRVDQIIVALPWAAEKRIGDVLHKLRSLPIDIGLAPDLIGFRVNHAGFGTMDPVGGVPLLTVCRRPLPDWHSVVKAIEDRTLAFLMLLFFLPLFALVAVAIKMDSKGPVFFRQKRYGFNNHTIGVYKFRSMYHEMRDEKAEKLATRNDPRITRLGSFLRKTSIDELPQLINVLKGEMSIVGPRPHALSAKAADRLYEDVVAEYAARHRVKPGITGWAQVNGWRGETDTYEKIEKRVEHDLYYVENWSLGFDLKILVLTAFALLKSENAY